MSAKLFKKDILFLQRILAVSGFYEGSLNGKWSSNVDDAEEKFLKQYEKIKGEAGEFDNRTEACIVTLIPAAQMKAREFMNAVKGRLKSFLERAPMPNRMHCSPRGRELRKHEEVKATTISGSRGMSAYSRMGDTTRAIQEKKTGLTQSLARLLRQTCRM
jgi:hypothetical protein